MRLYYLAVLYKHPTKVVTLKAAHDLTSFGFFQRSSVLEFMKFVSRTVVERSQPATRASVKQESYMCHVYARADNLAGVLISDHEYLNRVAHTLLNKVLDDFAAAIPATSWPTMLEDTAPFAELPTLLAKYQDPVQADAMTKIQADLDETKIILHHTIESLLDRGEKLDELVERSGDLSVQAKEFYKVARKTNSCCVLL